MKRIKVIFILLLGLVVLLSCQQKNKYFINVDFNSYKVNNNTVYVEYGDVFTIPSGTVVDDKMEEYDLDVVCSFIRSDGFDMQAIKRVFILDIGNYTLEYSTDDNDVKKAVYQIICEDTQAPIVTVNNLKTVYSSGDEFSYIIENIKDSSLLNDEKCYTKLISLKDNSEIKLNNNSSVLIDTGDYEFIVHYEDIHGNITNDIYKFKVVEKVEESLINNTLWGFETENSLNNVHPDSNSDNFKATISTEFVNGSEHSLKLELNDGYTIKFDLVSQNILASDIEDIIIKVYADNLVDNFRVYNANNGYSVNFDYQILKNKWYELSFKATDLFLKTNTISELRFEIYVEEETTIYLDGIYYTDYIEPVVDYEKYKFDKLDINLDGDIGTAQTVEDSEAEDGFSLYIKSVDGFSINIYTDKGMAVDKYKKIKIRFRSSINGTYLYLCGINDTTECVGYPATTEYQIVDFMPLIKAKKDESGADYENILSLNVFNGEIYIDYIEFIFDDGQENTMSVYNFDNLEVDFNTDGGECKMISDENAIDGYAYSITTSPSSTTYVYLNPQIVVKNYKSIIVRYRTTNNNYLYFAGTSLKTECIGLAGSEEYKEVDILPLIKETRKKNGTSFSSINTITTFDGTAIIDSITFVIDENPQEEIIEWPKEEEINTGEYVLKNSDTKILLGTGMLYKVMYSEDVNDYNYKVKSTKNSEAIMNLETPIDISLYKKIIIKAKSSIGGTYIYVCGNNSTTECVGVVLYTNFTEVDLIPLIKEKIDKTGSEFENIKYISVYNGDVFIDSIILHTDTGEQTDDNPYSYGKNSSAPYCDLGTAQIVEDADATDGYALSVVSNKNATSYIYPTIDITEYSEVIVRIKCSKANYVYFCGDNKKSVALNITNANTYYEFDIVQLITEKNDPDFTTIKSIQCYDGDYTIDYIKLTNK